MSDFKEFTGYTDFHLGYGKPPQFTAKDVSHYLLKNKLVFGARVHMDDHVMRLDAEEHARITRIKLAQALGEGALDKIKIETFRDPYGAMIQGKIVMMTEDELITLLGNFGIKIYVD